MGGKRRARWKFSRTAQLRLQVACLPFKFRPKCALHVEGFAGRTMMIQSTLPMFVGKREFGLGKNEKRRTWAARTGKRVGRDGERLKSVDSKEMGVEKGCFQN